MCTLAAHTHTPPHLELQSRGDTQVLGSCEVKECRPEEPSGREASAGEVGTSWGLLAQQSGGMW